MLWRKVYLKVASWFDDVPVGYLNCWARRGTCDVGAVWQGTGMEVVGSGRGIG